MASSTPLAEEFLSEAQEFNKSIKALETAHADYLSVLSDEKEIQDSQYYYESECQAIRREELRLRQEVIKQQQLQEEAKLRLGQRKRELDLERKIAGAQAEEQTYANAELETASVKQLSGIPAQVFPLPLYQQPFSPMKPRPPTALRDAKPIENK
ncbi:hypothetical protein AWC38_SpisGene22883 [Stylophora pistillata]|uniref:Uncharacterized protein n=1 Tax=Stylophora pistillata TaxID=50429 RepID=A0A2B4R9V6_STYPI|nr:hypothetical protein AWC38_SpisGene22883 [Stylophora pistillata]